MENERGFPTSGNLSLPSPERGGHSPLLSGEKISSHLRGGHYPLLSGGDRRGGFLLNHCKFQIVNCKMQIELVRKNGRAEVQKGGRTEERKCRRKTYLKFKRNLSPFQGENERGFPQFIFSFRGRTSGGSLQAVTSPCPPLRGEGFNFPPLKGEDILPSFQEE